MRRRKAVRDLSQASRDRVQFFATNLVATTATISRRRLGADCGPGQVIRGPVTASRPRAGWSEVTPTDGVASPWQGLVVRKRGPSERQGPPVAPVDGTGAASCTASKVSRGGAEAKAARCGARGRQNSLDLAVATRRPFRYVSC